MDWKGPREFVEQVKARRIIHLSNGILDAYGFSGTLCGQLGPWDVAVDRRSQCTCRACLRAHDAMAEPAPEGLEYLVGMLREHGVAATCIAIDSVPIALDRGWNLTGWYVQSCPGAVLLAHRAPGRQGNPPDAAVLIVNVASDEESGQYRAMMREGLPETSGLVLRAGELPA